MKVQMWLTRVAAVTAESDGMAGPDFISFGNLYAALLEMGEQGVFFIAKIENHMITGWILRVHNTGWVIG